MSVFLFGLTVFWCVAAEFCFRLVPAEERDGLMLAVCFLLGPLALLLGMLAGTIDFIMGRK